MLGFKAKSPTRDLFIIWLPRPQTTVCISKNAIQSLSGTLQDHRTTGPCLRNLTKRTFFKMRKIFYSFKHRSSDCCSLWRDYFSEIWPLSHFLKCILLHKYHIIRFWKNLIWQKVLNMWILLLIHKKGAFICWQKWRRKCIPKVWLQWSLF